LAKPFFAKGKDSILYGGVMFVIIIIVVVFIKVIGIVRLQPMQAKIRGKSIGESAMSVVVGRGGGHYGGLAKIVGHHVMGPDEHRQ
jgi:hypothetical protein